MEACTGLVVRVRGAGAARARWRSWPSRRRRVRCAARSAAPRPIAPTRAGCGRCWPRAGCRSRGSRPRTWASGALRRGLRKTLIDERTRWLQRIQATLFHHGIVNVPDQLLRANGRAFLRTLELPPAAGAADRDRAGPDRSARPPAERARARDRAPGAPPAGLPGADAPARDRAADRAHDPGRARQACRACRPRARPSAAAGSTSACTAPIAAPAPAGSPATAPRRCAGRSIEAAQSACQPASPDHADYLALKARGLSHTRASMTIARKLARRCFHILRDLGPDALAPVA